MSGKGTKWTMKTPKQVLRRQILKEYNERLRRQQKKDSNTVLPTLAKEIARIGWTLRDLGKATGLCYASISNIVHGKRVPNLESALKLSRALGIDFEKFALMVIHKYYERHQIKPIAIMSGERLAAVEKVDHRPMMNKQEQAVEKARESHGLLSAIMSDD